MNTRKRFNDLKLQALDKLNQNQRIELVKHEFNSLLDIDDFDIDKINEKRNELLEIENYLSSKGYYNDVVYGRYVTLSEKYYNLKMEKMLQDTRLRNLVIGELVLELWETFFYLTYLLGIYYDNFIVTAYLPMKYEDEAEIFEDSLMVRNEDLSHRLDNIIGVIYGSIVDTIGKLESSDKVSLDMLEDTDYEDKEMNQSFRDTFTEVCNGIEKLKEDGFILEKELELEINKEIWNEYNESKNLKPKDTGYIDTGRFSINNHISYDLGKCEVIFNDDFYDSERIRNEFKYLLLKPRKDILK